jgi:uncharacterized protein (TIGR02246 family)
MRVHIRVLLCGLAMVPACGVMVLARRNDGLTASAPAAERQEIEAFNKKFIEAHSKMDNAAVMSLWAEDGVSLLPGMAPLASKKEIGQFIDGVTTKMHGYHMEKMDVDFQGIEASGDWASEWGFEHQVIQPPGGQPPLDEHGKLLLVLHRQSDGSWKIKREMWNQGASGEFKK